MGFNTQPPNYPVITPLTQLTHSPPFHFHFRHQATSTRGVLTQKICTHVHPRDGCHMSNHTQEGNNNNRHNQPLFWLSAALLPRKIIHRDIPHNYSSTKNQRQQHQPTRPTVPRHARAGPIAPSTPTTNTLETSHLHLHTHTHHAHARSV